MNKTTKFVYSFLPLIIILLIILFTLSISSDKKQYLLINNNKIFITIADTPATRALGLSKHESLPAHHGMLFIFDHPVRPAFWMKDMDFPIDIIWIKDNEIKGIEKNIPIPNSQTFKHYAPPVKINYVLELNAGYSNKHQLKVGDRIKRLDLI